MAIKGIYVHLCLLETFCYLADKNSPIVLLEILQQPPPTTLCHISATHLHILCSSCNVLFMTASLDNCHMILSFAVVLQEEPKIASSKKSRYEVRKLPFPT